MSMRALILCGGLGTRLHPYTDTAPKPLLNVAGRPILHYMLHHLSHQGIKEVMINMHYRGEQIQSSCGDGSAFGLSIRYTKEETLLGTAGTVLANRDWLTKNGHDPCLVIYGDLLTNQNFNTMLDFHQKKKALLTLWVYPGQDNSIVKVDEEGRIVFFLERPDSETAQKIYREHDHLYINGGIQILSPELISQFPDKAPLDLPRDIYSHLAGTQHLYAFPLDGYRRNIDSLEALEKAQEEVTTYGLKS